jgi:hypothetical protein
MADESFMIALDRADAPCRSIKQREQASTRQIPARVAMSNDSIKGLIPLFLLSDPFP